MAKTYHGYDAHRLPCDDCSSAERCGRELLACTAYLKYAGCGWSGMHVDREPTRRLFEHYDSGDAA